MSYYFSNSPGEKIGPVSRNELLDLVKSGIVTETTLVSSAWRRRAAGRLSFLKSAFEKGKSEAPEDELSWRSTLSVSEDAGTAARGAFPYDYARDIYFAPFWKRSRRLRRTLKLAFWFLLSLLVLAVVLFAGSFTFLAEKTTLLGIFGNVFFGLTAFIVIFPLAFSLILCRVGIVSTYAGEAKVRAAEDLRKIRLLAETKAKGE
ncbi:MAG: DUF4339 domain-containing protein [Thermoguttaceae bacterium]|nr:DUF4339 domain-containing protein [Thermoguttaceae bacterium]